MSPHRVAASRKCLLYTQSVIVSHPEELILALSCPQWDRQVAVCQRLDKHWDQRGAWGKRDLSPALLGSPAFLGLDFLS